MERKPPPGHPLTMTDGEKDQFRDAFGAALRGRRHECGLSQEELAHRAGITMRYVSLLETGKRVPTIVVFAALARALGDSSAALMARVEGRL